MVFQSCQEKKVKFLTENFGEKLKFKKWENEIEKDEYSRINLWLLSDYQMINFIDRNALVLKNLDNLFSSSPPFTCASSFNIIEECGNWKDLLESKMVDSSVLSIHPNKRVYDELRIKMIANNKIKFDHFLKLVHGDMINYLPIQYSFSPDLCKCIFLFEWPSTRIIIYNQQLQGNLHSKIWHKKEPLNLEEECHKRIYLKWFKTMKTLPTIISKKDQFDEDKFIFKIN